MGVPIKDKEYDLGKYLARKERLEGGTRVLSYSIMLP
jgi:hypothetical protein